MEGRVQQLESLLEDKEVKLLQAAVFGQRLLEENERLRRAGREDHSLEREREKKNAETEQQLRVNALTAQLAEAERSNAALIAELEEAKQTEKKKVRSALALARQSGAGGAAEEEKKNQSGEAEGKKAGAEEREARRAEVLEKKRQEQVAELEERVAQLEREAQEKKKELERERERGAERERRFSDLEAEVLKSAEQAREKKSEAEISRRELTHLQLLIRQISEEKEMAEEKILEFDSRQNANGADSFRATESNLEAEKTFLKERDEARRAIAQIRKRNFELEQIRELVSVVTRENNSLASAIEAEKKARNFAEKKSVEAEIEIEIWKERVAKLQSQIDKNI